MVIFMFYYLNMFLIGSFLGFIMEFLLKTFVFTSMNSSILHGPWLPVYGFGVCIIIFIERFVFNRIKVNKFCKILIMFLLVMIIASFTEFLGGIFIEKVFDKVFWDYRDLKFNIGKYVALEVAFVWGILSLVFVYIVKPIIEKFIYKIPRWVSILVFSSIVVDFIITLMKV